MAQVNQSLIPIEGLVVNSPLVVDGGKDGSYAVAANQIKWGASKFNEMNSDGSVEERTIDTSQKLLTSIETSLANIKEYADSKSFDLDVADLWGEYIPTTQTPTSQP